MTSLSPFWSDAARLGSVLARAGLAEPGRRRAALEVAPEALWAASGPRHPPAFVARAQGLGERLGELAEWTRRSLAAEALVVLDEDGLPLLDASPDPDLAPYVAALVHSARRIGASLERAPPTRWSALLEAGRYLQVAAAETALGSHTVGLVARRPLQPPEVDLVSRGLRHACEPAAPAAPGGADR